LRFRNTRKGEKGKKGREKLTSLGGGNADSKNTPHRGSNYKNPRHGEFYPLKMIRGMRGEIPLKRRKQQLMKFLGNRSY